MDNPTQSYKWLNKDENQEVVNTYNISSQEYAHFVVTRIGKTGALFHVDLHLWWEAQNLT